MSVQLSEDQRKAVHGICNLFDSAGMHKHAIAVLTGSAGTGKTTIITELVRMLSTEYHVLLSATTHRAATVLQEVMKDTPIYEPVTTAHSLFKLKPVISKYGKESLKPMGKCTLPNGAIIIIDEASMISNKFLSAIVDSVQTKKLKILFVGDPYQLPPPKDSCTIFDGSLSTMSLTKVHRQKDGNPILDKAIEFRDYIRGVKKDEPTLITSINSKGEGIEVLPHSQFVSKFVSKYMSYTAGEFIDSPLCTYTNDSAINYNNMIRKAAYFLEGAVAPFYCNEQLISNCAIYRGGKSILANNELVQVIDYTSATYKGIPGHELLLTGAYDKKTNTRRKSVFMPLNKIVANTELDKLKKEALATRSWTEFYDLKNELADLRPPFAGTTHKSQGGTFTNVFIDQVNINKCIDPLTRAKLMYVALTRATKNVYINS